MSKASSAPTPSGFKLSSLFQVNTLLIFLPITLLLRAGQAGDVVIFGAAALAIIPLAGLIGTATEAVAAKLGPGLGGLINATLGNAAELIITIFALRAGLVELVKASIIGSVIGNLLFVLGLSMVMGGLKNRTQSFDRRTASMNATFVILAFMLLAIPSAFHDAIITAPDGSNRELFFSEGLALIIITLYGLYLVYTLRNPVSHETEPHHHGAMSTRTALIVLTLATLGIVLMSETLVGTVEAVGHTLGLSEFFIGIIIVPLIGNVAEHMVAVQVAYKNRMDLSLSISLGSSLQIGLFVAPILVFISLLFEKKLLLVFNAYELLALAVASVVAALVSLDGESNWLEGVVLLAVYVIFGLAFFLIPSASPAVIH